MPFEYPAGHVFSAVSINRNAPAQEGVYGISNAREWIFIGVARDIRAALLKHLHETNTTLASRHPTGFTFELQAPVGQVARLERLIREYRPICYGKN